MNVIFIRYNLYSVVYIFFISDTITIPFINVSRKKIYKSLTAVNAFDIHEDKIFLK